MIEYLVKHGLAGVMAGLLVIGYRVLSARIAHQERLIRHVEHELGIHRVETKDGTRWRSFEKESTP